MSGFRVDRCGGWMWWMDVVDGCGGWMWWMDVATEVGRTSVENAHVRRQMLSC